MLIKTKIVATVGPASWDVPVLTELAKAGADVFRVNFSHGTRDEHARMLANVRAASKKLREPLAVMADLCGPKIRVGKVAGGGVLLAEGSEIIIQRKPVEGTAERISTTLPELIDDIRKGERLSMDDGRLELEVVRKRGRQGVVCRVLTGGILGSSKGVNLPDTDLRLSALTEKDHDDARWIAQQDFDYVALSFVQRAEDIRALRKLLDAGGSDARIVAKIEKPQALRNIESIVAEADVLLVARGDMGVEMKLPEVPIAQKKLIRLAEKAGKCCIVATQMLESMIVSPIPTRAEVSDVANAVLDGADAVMLSGETAVGKHPVTAVKMMNSIAHRVEQYLAGGEYEQDSCCEIEGAEGGVVSGVHAILHATDIKAVAAFTATGRTARLLGKMRLEAPILALTPQPRVMQQACLFYGVQAEHMKTPRHTRDVVAHAARRVKALKWATKGDKIVVVTGRPLGRPGASNTIVVHTL